MSEETDLPVKGVLSKLAMIVDQKRMKGTNSSTRRRIVLWRMFFKRRALSSSVDDAPCVASDLTALCFLSQTSGMKVNAILLPVRANSKPVEDFG